MSGDERYTIGELARRTGLSVKTIRFYADHGIVPPSDRSPAGYRLFDAAAVAQLELVRTLRELGVDLAAIRRVVDRQVPLHEVAATHAEALAAQIRVLRLRQAVLTVAARRGAGPSEVDDLHRLAQLTAHERTQLVDDFLDSVFAGDPPTYPGVLVSMTPELPDDPSAEQIQAWIELAELCRDPAFRASMRRLARQHATDNDVPGLPRPDAVALVRHGAAAALAAGLDPSGDEAEPVVAAVTDRYARLHGLAGDADLRQRLLDRLVLANDPRRDRYLDLLSVINGWSGGSPVAPAVDWFVRALRARMSLAAGSQPNQVIA
ncbi:MerR family transcriptional regulator [Micromonospora sp. WMMD736]|uniref:MerR family transcriptional regulator n=1 Tax=Micromonospora sp. WMMD736 TaxID=3404112 RepID=UPI003B960249